MFDWLKNSFIFVSDYCFLASDMFTFEENISGTWIHKSIKLRPYPRPPGPLHLITDRHSHQPPAEVWVLPCVPHIKVTYLLQQWYPRLQHLP